MAEQSHHFNLRASVGTSQTRGERTTQGGPAPAQGGSRAAVSALRECDETLPWCGGPLPLLSGPVGATLWVSPRGFEKCRFSGPRLVDPEGTC